MKKTKKIISIGVITSISTSIMTLVSCNTQNQKQNQNQISSTNSENEVVAPKIKQLDLEHYQNYINALETIQNNFKTLAQDEGTFAVHHLQTGGRYSRDLYFVAKNDDDLIAQATPILEKFGFSGKLILKLKDKKVGDNKPTPSRQDFNVFSIGYKDIDTNKYTYFGAPLDPQTSKSKLYDTKQAAIDAFLASNLKQTTSSLYNYFEKLGGRRNDTSILDFFEKTITNFEVTNDLQIVKNFLQSKSRLFYQTLENNIYQSLTSRQAQLEAIVNKWIPGGVNGQTNNSDTQKAYVFAASDKKLSRGSGKYLFSLRIDKNIGGGTSSLKKATNKFDNYLINYGTLNGRKNQITSTFSNRDLLRGIKQYAIVDFNLKYNHKSIVLIFIKMHNRWISVVDYFKHKDATANFILDDYWATTKDNKGAKIPTIFKKEGNAKFTGVGLDQHQQQKYKDLVDYVKLVLQ